VDGRERVGDEAFLLDVLNSTPMIDAIEHDEMGTEEAGRSWLRAHGHPGTALEWEHLRAARVALQAVVRGQRAPRSLAALLQDVSYRASTDGDEVCWVLDVPPERSAAVRAVLAWDALRRARPGRLRPCENPECALFFVDHSKPNKARWCSMAACGNRMKARRHYERTRGGGG
jgi:predicted RNA-binding Zn ribbon-like protein